MTETIRLFRAAVVATAPVMFVGVTAWLWSGRLPDPIATHWDVAGNVDRTNGLAATLTTILLLAGVPAVAALVMAVTRLPWRVRRAVIVTASAVTSLAAGVWAITAGLALNVPDAAAVESPGWQIVALILGWSAWAGLVILACGPGPEQPGAAGRPPAGLARLDLGDGQRVVWSEVSGVSRWAYLALAPLLVFGVALVLVNPWVTVVMLLVAGFVLVAFQTRITVDARGVTVGFGPWGRPRVRVPMREIVAARPDTVRVREWGGWGYRTSLDTRGRGLIQRGGPAVRFELTADRYFVATVRDPETVSALVNGLLDTVRAD